MTLAAVASPASNGIGANPFAANTPTNISGTNAIAKDQLAVFMVVTGNAGSVDGPSNEHLALTISSNSFTKLYETCIANGGANKGQVLSVWALTNGSTQIASSNAMLTTTGGQAGGGCYAHRFSRDVAQVIDIAAGVYPRLDYQRHPGAATIDTGVSSREHLFIRAFGADQSAAFTPSPDMLLLGGNGTFVNNRYVYLRSEYKIATASYQLSQADINAQGNYVSVGLALFERVGAVPVNTTLLDDFNRADAAPMPATALWSGKTIDTNVATTLSLNGSMVASPTGLTSNYSLTTYGPDLDIQFDMGVGLTSNIFGLEFGITNPGTTNYACYQFLIGSSNWTLNYTTNAGSTQLQQVAQTNATGDSVWIRKRGSSISVYKRASGATLWTPVISVTDSTLTGTGAIALYANGFIPTGKLDNLRGGTVTATKFPILV